MNNISAIGYNLQALFSQVSTLNAKVSNLENEMLQAKVPSQKVLDTGITHKLQTLEDRYASFESSFKSLVATLDRDIQALKTEIQVNKLPITTEAAASQTIDVVEPPSYAEATAVVEPSNAVPEEDDLFMSVAPPAPPKAKGGRKKKA